MFEMKVGDKLQIDGGFIVKVSPKQWRIVKFENGKPVLVQVVNLVGGKFVVA